MNSKNNISFWFSQLDEPGLPRPELTEDITADIVIVGAGFTGLWTAYYLKQIKPELNIVILEARIAAYGASGRNGGWLMGMVEDLEGQVAHLPLEKRRAAFNEVHSLIDEVARVTELENIPCDLTKGGAIYAAARFAEQIPWAEHYLKLRLDAGHDEEDFRWLNAGETREHINLREVYGAVYCKHVAAIQPAKLGRGLAKAVEKLGVQIYEQSPALLEDKNADFSFVRTAKGSVKADVCVLATEGFSFGNNALQPYIIPLQSKIIATEPLSDSLWQEIGFQSRQTFCDFSRLQTYVQRSADGRLIFGARGVYEYGGKPFADRVLPESDPGFQLCKRLMHDFFPALRHSSIEYQWAGTFGMARKFSPHVIYDKSNHFATAGGYGGEGVGASNLFGRTLAELILGQTTVRTDMPWVSTIAIETALKRWEPEPFRWLTYALAAKVFSLEEKFCCDSNSSKLKKRLFASAANTIERLL
ncbi:MAG: NAD(P)/FAD-dependent oxidoreductase [Pseudomonadales bacterium]